MLGGKLTNVSYKHLNVAPYSQPTNRVVGLLRPPCGLLPPFPSVVHKLFWRADVREYSACSVTYGIAFSLTNAPPYLPYSMCMAIQVSVQRAQLFRMKSRYDFMDCVSRVRVQWLPNGKKSIVAFTAVVYARVCLSFGCVLPFVYTIYSRYVLRLRVNVRAPLYICIIPEPIHVFARIDIRVCARTTNSGVPSKATAVIVVCLLGCLLVSLRFEIICSWEHWVCVKRMCLFTTHFNPISSEKLLRRNV